MRAAARSGVRLTATAEALAAPMVTVDRRLLRACRDAGLAIDLEDLAVS